MFVVELFDSLNTHMSCLWEVVLGSRAPTKFWVPVTVWHHEPSTGQRAHRIDMSARDCYIHSSQPHDQRGPCSSSRHVGAWDWWCWQRVYPLSHGPWRRWWWPHAPASTCQRLSTIQGPQGTRPWWCCSAIGHDQACLWQNNRHLPPSANPTAS